MTSSRRTASARSFFNATARTAEGYVGLIFRRPPFVKVPESDDGVGRALAGFVNDADMRSTTLAAYAKDVVWEVMGVGRAGSLVDWEDVVEKRAYVSLYSAEQIINWQVGARERAQCADADCVARDGSPDRRSVQAGDEFVPETVEQIRVLKLVAGDVAPDAGGKRDYHCQVDLWQPKAGQKQATKTEWQLVETRTPLRLGRPLPLIPFVFHGPRHSRPDVDRLPLTDVIAVEPGPLPAQCRLQAWAAFYRAADGVGQRVPQGVEFADWLEHGLVFGDAGRDGGIFGVHRAGPDYV